MYSISNMSHCGWLLAKSSTLLYLSMFAVFGDIDKWQTVCSNSFRHYKWLLVWDFEGLQNESTSCHQRPPLIKWAVISHLHVKGLQAEEKMMLANDTKAMTNCCSSWMLLCQSLILQIWRKVWEQTTRPCTNTMQGYCSCVSRHHQLLAILELLLCNKWEQTQQAGLNGPFSTQKVWHCCGQPCLARSWCACWRGPHGSVLALGQQLLQISWVSSISFDDHFLWFDAVVVFGAALAVLGAMEWQNKLITKPLALHLQNGQA